MMASKILEYTQCSTESKKNTHASYIEIQDKNNTPTSQTVFNEGENFSLIPVTENGNWNYSWTARNPN